MNAKDLLSLQNRVILITGGAGYLGSTLSKSLLEFGGTVVVADIVERKPDEIVGKNSITENLKVIKCDLSSTDSIKDMFKCRFTAYLEEAFL